MRKVLEETKQLRGTGRPDRQRKPTAGGGVGRMPSGLGPAGKRAWRLVVANLGSALSPLDALALHQLCLHYEMAIAASEELREQGHTTKDNVHGGMLKRTPSAIALQGHSDRLLKLLKEFGGTPLARLAMADMFAANEEDAVSQWLAAMVGNDDQ